MRMILNVSFPPGKFNAAVREGTIGPTISRILEETKPEAAYFTEEHGRRTGILVVNLDDVSEVPALAEPWFLHFDADCRIRVAMTPADLEKSGLAEIGKKWA